MLSCIGQVPFDDSLHFTRLVSTARLDLRVQSDLHPSMTESKTTPLRVNQGKLMVKHSSTLASANTEGEKREGVGNGGVMIPSMTASTS